MAETQSREAGEEHEQPNKRMIKLKGLFGLMVDTETETVVRPENLPFPLLPANPNFVNGVASRDILISDSPSIWARMFLPERRPGAAATDNPPRKKLPVILYFHGGAFVLLSPAISFYHQFCEKMARKTNALVISVDYRLVPEHRLPAAYEDASTALKWLDDQVENQETADPWLADRQRVDPESCFLMGDSAGGNIVHHLAAEVAAVRVRVTVTVKGVVMVQPMMGGADRLRSELVAARSGFFSLETNDWLWRLALPRGSGGDMSHRYCDLVAAAAAAAVEGKGMPAAMVVMSGLDWMHDRQFEYAAALRKAGVEVEVVDYEHAKHGFFIYDTPETTKFFKALAGFIDKRNNNSSCSSSSSMHAGEANKQ